MSGFSPSLTLAGMDYIAPSMECIKPTQPRAVEAATATVGRHAGQALSTGAASTTAPGRQEVMKITLADCLACSGCVTTAETVLVEAQSRKELCSALGLPPPPDALPDEGEQGRTASAGTTADTVADVTTRRRRPVLVTISEPSAASLAAHCGVSLSDALSMISGFMRTVLCDPATERSLYVSDLGWALDLSTELTTKEYQRRVGAHAAEGVTGAKAPAQLPMLVSACPGWVCYCEKQGATLLPLLCPVLSPQGIAGSLAKRVVDEDLYHISIQPCFDRKLEAARDGYFATNARERRERKEGNEEEPTMTPYTDCVLSTAELLEWMTEVDTTLPWRAALDSDGAGATTATSNAGTDDDARMEGSGGYHRRVLEALTRSAAGAPSDVPVDITYETKRNRNHQIARAALTATSAGEGMVSADDGAKHCVCVAYGFQQIQNIVRGIRKNLPVARQYTFIELMACPDGCLNGGGQIRVLSGEPQGHAARLAETEKALQHFLATTPDAHVAAEASGEKLFSKASVARMRETVGPNAFRCTFRDRQKEFEEMLNQGNIHSLKW